MTHLNGDTQPVGGTNVVDGSGIYAMESEGKMKGRWSLVVSALVAAAVALTATAGHTRMKENAAAEHNRLTELARATADIPNTQNRSHRVGNVWMTVTNYGFFGSQFRQSQLAEQVGPYAGQLAPSFEFPAGSGINYLFQGAIWFGALVGIDTLVSVGADGWQWVNETFPVPGDAGAIIELSTRRSSENFSEDAVSEQDYVAVYTDTLTDQTYVAADEKSGRPHMPIGLQITQKSYAWSYDYAQDFILIDFILKNISTRKIEKPYMALYVDADCWHEATPGDGFADDYSGYLAAVPSPYPGLMDSINIAWTADNDGDPVGGIFNYMSPTGISGTRVVRGPASEDEGSCGPAPLNYAFNWWISNGDTRFDWGPQHLPPDQNVSGGFGTPDGDAHKYRIMSNGEFDYDQLFAAIDYSEEGWMEPNIQGENLADGYDTRYLFSFGPLDDMEPGDSTYVTVGYVGGEGFHVNADDFENYYDYYRPEVFYDKLDFSDFAVNAQWAAWVFDNPGVDTDDDGCFGLYNLVNCKDTIIIGGDTIYGECDTVWYAGDGEPDFQGPPPPPPPDLQVIGEPKSLKIQWTGIITELTPDDFTLRRDFEGYRLYYADFNTLASYALVASWDLIDFKRYDLNPSSGKWVQNLDPLLLDTLKVWYGEVVDTVDGEPVYEFDPTQYPSPERPFTDEYDSSFYFVVQDKNQGDTILVNSRWVPNKIQRVSTDSVVVDPDAEIKVYDYFGVYECVIENLLPSQTYYVSVTAFDFGNREMLAPLESSPMVNAVGAYPMYTADKVAELDLKVTAFPNPYKISDDYRGRGYEDRDRSGWSERSRRVYFANLPKVATIKIFTLDGDLVRVIEHEPGGTFTETSSVAWWDLISSNTQAIVSGIYLFAVESDAGTQIGKLVIIK